MHRLPRALITGAALAALLLPRPGRAEDEDLQKKVVALTKEVEALKQREKKNGDKSLGRWLTIGGDYRLRIDSLHGDVPQYFQFVGPTTPPALTPASSPKNDTLLTNRFGLNMKAKVTEDVSFAARLVMYKTFGMMTADSTNAGFFADRTSVLDGSVGHIPLDNTVRIDQVYATWSNIGGQPIWFSAGRRPSTGGSPTHVRLNGERPTSSGVPGVLVDYAFDGLTLGVAPDIGMLPGAYAKFCYGRGFEGGFSTKSGHFDTDMVGLQVVPIDTDPFRLDLQWNRGFNIFDNPNNVGNQLGDMDWYGIGALSTLKRVGPGNLTFFASGGLSVTHPNSNHALLAGPGSPDSGAGLLVNGPDTSSHNGWSMYAGARYDFASGTKIGAEYNHGSQFWTPFDPAADDIWTSKLGARGNVYEAYLIQELPLASIASFSAKTFFRIGYQYYDFTFTGSNNWVGAPVRISDLTASPFNAQLFAPLKSAQDIYGTFEVRL